MDAGMYSPQNGSAAPEQRSVMLGGARGKVMSSPFDTPSTTTPLTTKGSQNTSVATDPVTGKIS